MKIFLSLFFVLFPSLCFGDYNWKLITKSKNGDFYLDMKSIEIKGDKRLFLRLRDYKKIDQYGERSNIIFFEIDCKNLKIRFIKDMYFEGHMGKGKSKILNEVGNWVTFKKNSIGEYFNNIVCSVKK